MKRIVQLFFLILSLQLINIVLAIPYYIPSWQKGIEWFTWINYILLGLLLILMFILAITQNIKKKSNATKWIGSMSLCLLSGGGIYVGFFATIFMVIGMGFSPTFEKKFSYKKTPVTVYVYETGFMEPGITLMVRKGWLPILKEVHQEEATPDDVIFDENKDCLYIYSSRDTVQFDAQQIMKL